MTSPDVQYVYIVTCGNNNNILSLHMTRRAAEETMKQREWERYENVRLWRSATSWIEEE